jgi:uncharacterized protein involved in exopolysaccharide biosynthesis
MNNGQRNGHAAPAVADDWIEWRPVFTRHKTLLISVVLAAVVGAYIAVRFVLPEIYEAKASVLVKLGRENTELPATVQAGSFISGGVRREELNSEIQMLTAPSLIAAVVDEIGLEAFRAHPRPAETGWRAVVAFLRDGLRWAREAVDSLLIALGLKKHLTEREKILVGIESALKVAAELESQVITVRLRLPDPDLAVRVLSILLQRYHDRHIEVWRTVNAKEFFDAQVGARRQHVQQLEAAREAVKAKLDLVSVGEQRAIVLKQLDAIRTEIEGNRAKKAGAEAQERAMRARLDALPDQLRQSENITPNPLIQTRKDRLTVLEQELARRLGVYDRDSAPVKNIEQEIAHINRLIEGETPTIVGTLTLQAHPLKAGFQQSIEQTRVLIEGLDSSTRQLQAQAAALEARLREINAGDQQLRALDREHKLAEESYITYAKRMEEGRISEELDRRRVANITVLSAPVKPLEPVSPRKLLIMALSLPLGLFLAVGLALLAEYLREKVTTGEDVARVGEVTYLGTVRL